ncbi:hypothetical protein [Crassaminicella profunda]|uniref:hypothetical protein n=1 Tax=Crassaminicella profunda TaxID=1286698 RepID=UPI001CA6A0DD|nr:hypothetical protein [Crassaminicella profunda]QZY54901.1 hypothetical protein K7H06_18060 [Crassaminicella profunda]
MRFFGPTQRDVWEKVSKEIEGEFIVTDGLLKLYEVRKKFKDWEIILEKHSSGERYSPTNTRVYATFYNKHGFKFKIFDEYFKNYFSSFFDMQDIEIDQSGFSREFIIRSNSQTAMKRFFENPTIRELMNMEEDILFEINGANYYDVHPAENANIEIKICGIIKDTELLKNMFELIATCLLEIKKINDAYEKLDINDFSKFDVMKSSIKNISYDQIKEKLGSKIKEFKNKSKDEEISVETVTEPADKEKIKEEILVKEEKVEEIFVKKENIEKECIVKKEKNDVKIEILHDEKKDSSQDMDERIKESIAKKNDFNESMNPSSEIIDLSEYLKTLSVFNMDSDQPEKKEEDRL